MTDEMRGRDVRGGACVFLVELQNRPSTRRTNQSGRVKTLNTKQTKGKGNDDGMNFQPKQNRTHLISAQYLYMSSKRSQGILHGSSSAAPPKRLKAGTKEPEKLESLPAQSSCPFQSLGDDELCHILSYILCLPKPVLPPIEPSGAHMHYYRSLPEDERNKIGKAAALAEFLMLSRKKAIRYYIKAVPDWKIFHAENRAYRQYLKHRLDYPKNLADDCQTLKLVSKGMRRIVCKFTNAENAPTDIIMPEDLAEIKARVGRLDLSSVRRTFLNLCDDMYCGRKFLPSDAYHHHAFDDVNHCPLEYILRHYADGDRDKFAKAISIEYRKFLVVKAVELQAQKMMEGKKAAASSLSHSTSSAWLSSSMSGQLIHAFWQAHMCMPLKYFEDCMVVTGGEIIDCGCSSYSQVDPATVCQYIEKRKSLFSFEHQLRKEHFHTGRQPALYIIQNAIEVASMLREEEEMEAAAVDDDSSDGDDEGNADNESEDEHAESIVNEP